MRKLSFKKRKTTALVLGSGGARGWAHIGVLKALDEAGFVPDICVGTSIGSIAAAVLGSGALPDLLMFAAKFDFIQASKIFVEPSFNKNGFLRGKRMVELLEKLIPARDISELNCRYAAVATNLENGEEAVFAEGSLMEAIRASVSIPGLFTPAKIGGGHFVDGGLVNPLPISVARAMGADFVIAVNINNKAQAERAAHSAAATQSTAAKLINRIFKASADPSKMTLFEVFTHSLRIAEDRMTLDCVRANPPDILIEPAVGDIATLDFTRADEAIEAGYAAMREKLENIKFNAK
ncbi:MAG: patatin-like phospholipase family protein [Kiritimatiellaeota bacterium]|nr:patatin-like phospholipase family protein [Kiritimatiellota bacterium]